MCGCVDMWITCDPDPLFGSFCELPATTTFTNFCALYRRLSSFSRISYLLLEVWYAVVIVVDVGRRFRKLWWVPTTCQPQGTLELLLSQGSVF